ncbi:unnamed protein product (macronuclear) [Paramecium tetraurelia]|uniref:Chromosome undetermined scaffold_1, whole genome shotgun sequence n=1 Tax=Paramecium tetraurelia TaxID=5888 RepID=Q6BG82_PARTE|nr:hypothetical protein [Paramecium tetraurelia strain d4-2]XP_001423354.1 uncharacterized protein GSPATT00000391001 [Paramecium tetraurelia]CAH03338.1 Conserved hypothetical protein [Paramecium tetraurelia]CAK55956.1 unnamed protein product [Paramecium tetraurelia]|eukprot:XP_001423354.1 hypothetical protein (macronuclear) [Paramecium tetraurelia strain d4-2]
MKQSKQPQNQAHDDQFSGSNTPNVHGLFLPQTMTMGQMSEDRKGEDQRLKLIRASTDPYEAFKDDDFLYPTKEDEMSLWQKYSGDYIQGMPVLPTGKCSLFCNIVCCFYFLIFGLVFVGIAGSITEIRLNYGKECEGKQQCIVNFEIEKNTYGPFFIYYELNEFYTSHSDFAQSISPKQMKGQELTDEEYDVYCPDTQSFESLQRPVGFNKSYAGFMVDLNKKVSPCGIAAKYIFNDSFLLFDANTETATSLALNSTGIAFSVDLDYKYSRSQNSQFRQWLDLDDEKIINWFNIQSLPLVRKLYARYDNDLAKGTYSIVIQNNYPTQIFGGEKFIIVTTLSSFGSKNFSFGYLLIATAGVQFISAIVVYIKHRIVEKKEKHEQKIHADLKLKEKSD